MRFSSPSFSGIGRHLAQRRHLHREHVQAVEEVLSEGPRNAPWIVRCVIVEFFVLGLLTSPRRTLAAWRAARSCRTLFTAPLPYEALLDMAVGELRAHLGVPPDGLAARASTACRP